MNVKNNKRRRESAERIKNAFLELLEEKELSQIKVSQICKEADINRSTFYSAYADIYDLADKIRKEMESEVNFLFSKEETLKFNLAEFLKLLQHIKENQKLYTFFFKLGYDSDNIRFYNFEDMWEEFDKQYINYHIVFFKNGFNAIVKLWLENGCKESPEEICDILLFEYRGRFEK